MGFDRYKLRCFDESNVPENIQEEMMDFLEKNKTGLVNYHLEQSQNL